MTVIRITNFSGISPRTSKRYLSNEQAQIALNCKSWVGPLKPINDTEDLSAFAKAGTILSIYRFGQDVVTPDTQYWFHWLTAGIDVVKGFIAGDTSERTFFTGDGVPKATDSSLALTGGGTEYPIASYMLGVPVPDTAPSCVVTGTPDEGATDESRVYTYTWVNSWDEESAPYAADPMPAGTLVDVSAGEVVEMTLPAPPSGAFNLSSRRIYRSVQGTGIFLFVAEQAAALGSYDDTVLADELGEEMPSLTWDPPPATLEGLVGLDNGILAGFIGNDIYPSEPYRPFAWPVQYQQSVGYQVVGLGAIDTTIVVLTQGKPSFLQGSHPDSMVLVEADVSQACSSKESIVSMNGAVIYASPDGMVALAPGGSQVITADLFEKEQWQALFKPESIHAYSHDGRYIAFYDNGVTQGGFIFDPATKSMVIHDIYAAAGYSDLKWDDLYLVVNNRLHKWEAGTVKTYTWRSKMFNYGTEIGFSCYRVTAESYPVTIKFYADSGLILTKAVPDGEIYRLPPEVGRDWEIELTGTAEAYVEVAQSPEELVSG